ncbi:MAG: PIN-like domain-containing protein, partial [Sphingobacteriaceae bacterium]
MKKEFIGYYNPSDKEISDAWNKGTFAFDANTLLNLYRYSENTRKDFLSALKAIKQKLFLPHQAALEFHSNRIGVIEGIGHSYDNLYKIFENNFEKNLEPQINQFKKHPVIS